MAALARAALGLKHCTTRNTWQDLPTKRRTRWDYVISHPDGPRHVWVECLDDATGIADWKGDDYFAVILNAYLGLARHRHGPVGTGQG